MLQGMFISVLGGEGLEFLWSLLSLRTLEQFHWKMRTAKDSWLGGTRPLWNKGLPSLQSSSGKIPELSYTFRQKVSSAEVSDSPQLRTTLVGSEGFRSSAMPLRKKGLFSAPPLSVCSVFSAADHGSSPWMNPHTLWAILLRPYGFSFLPFWLSFLRMTPFIWRFPMTSDCRIWTVNPCLWPFNCWQNQDILLVH